MNYQKPSFSVPMPSHVKNWPFKRTPMGEVASGHRCPECGAPLSLDRRPHRDARDAGRVRQRICFGVRQ